MPSSIPYDPSLVLASVVTMDTLTNVENISTAQGPVDAAQDALNSLISSKYSLDMTKTEIKNLGADTGPLDTEMAKLTDSITAAAVAYASAKLKAEPEIQKLRDNIRSVHASIESPIDYLRTEIKTMPLAADTMNMDVQYFSYDKNSQNADTFSAQIASYVSKNASSVIGSQSAKLANAASAQVSGQVTAHDIEGTLVVSVSCTHKNASILAPFVLQIDKAIKVWNHLFPAKKLDPTSRTAMEGIASNESQEDKEKFSIISGTTFGSSFVGMVHVLNSTSTQVGETLTAAAQSLQATMDSGAWFAKAGGKTGVDAKFGNDVKNLLSQQNVTSHVTLLSMGVIPSMVATDVKWAVKEFSDFDPRQNMEQVAVLQNATSANQSSVESMAEAARTGEQSADLKGKTIQSALSALGDLDDVKNKVLDINSMMTALEDYLKKASTGDSGVPINYYLKDIDQKMLAEMWVAKYFPGQFMAIKYDDSKDSATKGSGGGEGDVAVEKAKL